MPRHVHDLEHQPLIERAVAEETGGHLFRPPRLGRQRGPGCEREAAADDAVGPEIAVGGVADVQRAAAAAAIAVAAPEDLRHEPVAVCALGEAMPVATVAAGDIVRRFQRGTDTDRGGLLAGAQMNQAGNLAAEIQPAHLLLEPANPEHGAQHRDEVGLGHAL